MTGVTGRPLGPLDERKAWLMKVVVIGGTGLIGSRLVASLGDHGHEAVAASPNTGVDTLTGDGLAEALDGAAVVVDVSNSPSFEDAAVLDFFTTSTTNLMAAEAAAGVGHHVAVSIVGADLLPDSGYLRAKVAQERVIRESGRPFSIVRATQFFEFSRSIAQAATVGDEVHLPPVGFQPIAADDVVDAVRGVSLGHPVDGTVQIAGPERFRFDEFIGRALSALGEPRVVVADARARYFGTELGDTSLVPTQEAQLGETTFEKWVAAQ